MVFPNPNCDLPYSGWQYVHTTHSHHDLSLLVYFLGAIAAVVLSCADDQGTRYCINDEVHHKCTAPPTLAWVVLDDQGGQLGVETCAGIEALGVAQSVTGAGDFSVALLSNDNPLVSNIQCIIQC